MIVTTDIVEQTTDLGRRVRVVKEIVRVDGASPLALVRKRRIDAHDHANATHGPVLLVHGFGQNRYAWHLSQRSLSAHLAAEGFDVWNLDLRGHGRSRAFGSGAADDLDGYIHHDLPAVLREVQEVSARPRVAYIGHSMGALLGHVLAATERASLSALVSIAAPYRFGLGNPWLRELARAVVKTTGPLPRATELPMRLVRGIFELPVELWDHPRIPIPMRMWEPRTMEPEVLREYLRRAFDRATFGELAQVVKHGLSGRFESGDATRDYALAWKGADLPVLVIAGAHDLLAPPASVWPVFHESASPDKHFRQVPFGHGDLILGREAPQRVWPMIASWLAERVA